MAEHLQADVDAALRGLVERADEVIADVVDAMARDAPEFVSRLDLDEYRQYAILLLVGVVNAVREDASPSPRLLERVRTAMADRVDAGLTLEDSLRAFALGRNAVWHILHDELGELSLADFEPVRARADRWVDGIQVAAVRGYADHAIARRDTRSRRVRRLIHELADDLVDAETVRAVQQLVGDGPVRVIVGGELPSVSAAVAAERRGVAIRVQPAHAPLPEGPCGVSQPHEGQDVATAYREATAVADLATDSPVRFEDADLWVVADASAAIVRTWLPSDPALDDLIEAAVVWLEAGRSLSDAGDVLFVHGNTVLRRVHRLQEVAGLDLDDPTDQARFWLAVELRRGSDQEHGCLADE